LNKSEYVVAFNAIRDKAGHQYNDCV